MGKTDDLTLTEVRAKGYQALLQGLGPAGFIRFLQQHDSPKGDYTAERHQWLDRMTASDIRTLLDAQEDR